MHVLYAGPQIDTLQENKMVYGEVLLPGLSGPEVNKKCYLRKRIISVKD